MMKQKKQNESSRRDRLLVRIIVGLWITAVSWLVALFFYVGVTERYFTDPAAGVLLFLPETMIVAAILLQSWRKNGKQDKKAFYIQLVAWGLAWVSLLVKTFLQ